MSRFRSLTLVVPLYNEEKRFRQSFSTFRRLSKENPNWQFIFVNDGSQDKTGKIVRKAILGFSGMKLISYKRNRGKGYAIKQGMMLAKNKYILFSDIDFSTPLSELELFIPFIKKKADIIIGTRKVKGAVITRHQNASREWLGRQFTDIANLWLGMDISDYTCGFKLFRADKARELFRRQKINRWGFDAEILFLAQLYGFKIVEVPVTWRNDPMTRVKLARDIARSLWDLFRIRWYYWKEEYRK